MPDHQAPDPDPAELKRRALRLFAEWLDAVEAALPAARPDFSKANEWAGLFTIFKREREIAAIERRLAPDEHAAQAGAPFSLLDPSLPHGGIPPEDDDE